MNRYRTLAVVGLAVLLGPGFAGVGSAEDTAEPARPVLTVTVHVAETETVGPYVGLIAPRYQTPLSFRVSGRLLTRPMQRGDSVDKGDVLASLESTIQYYQLQSAEADFASAEAQLGNAEESEARVKVLFDRGTASKAQLDSVVTARRSAEAQRDQARANLSQAKDQLSYTTLTAEFAGLVISTDAEVGQIVAAGQTVVTLARPDIREAVFQLPENEAELLDDTAIWQVRIAGTDGEAVTATLRELSPLISGSARSRTVRLSLDSPPQDFRLGALVTVSCVREIAPRLSVPASAVVTEDGESFVWVVDPATLTVSRQVVTLSSPSKSSVTVDTGLADGDIVITAGVHSLEAGQKVALSDEDGAK